MFRLIMDYCRLSPSYVDVFWLQPIVECHDLNPPNETGSIDRWYTYLGLSLSTEMRYRSFGANDAMIVDDMWY